MTERDRQYEFAEWLKAQSPSEITPYAVFEELERWYAWGVKDERERIKAALGETDD